MGDKTGISWTDATWNPTKGCEQVSPGCRNCYAKHQAARIVRMSKGKPSKYDGLVKSGPHGDPCWTGEGAFDAEALTLPLRWRSPRRVFVDSMSDLFFEKFTNEQIAAVFGVIAAAPQHTFQVLTKRARRMREWFEWVNEWPVADSHCAEQRVTEAAEKLIEPRLWTRTCHSIALSIETLRWPLANVWLGVSVENQAAADERIPELLRTPAAVRFLSCEPLIGPVHIGDGDNSWLSCRGCEEWDEQSHCCESYYVNGSHFRGIDWVIAGCESGPGARPCSVEWLRSLRDQCAAAGVPFFLKQARQLPYIEGVGIDPSDPIACGPGSRRKHHGVIELPYLDGVQHAAFPEVQR